MVPALNEESALSSVLTKCRAAAPRAEIVVVDAGSSDRTREVAEAHAARCRVIAPGRALNRGQALNAGAAAATGESLWFLHADAAPEPAHVEALESAFARTGRRAIVGGAFEFGFTAPGWKLRVVEGINRVRYRVRQRYYGDQGIFVARDAFAAVGGFPEYGIMEDAHFCRDLRRHGRTALLGPVLPTSPRRFLNGGVFRVLWMDMRIWARDAVGCDVQSWAARYRAENLNSGVNRE